VTTTLADTGLRPPGTGRGESRGRVAIGWALLVLSAGILVATLAATSPQDRFLDLSIYRGAVDDAASGGSLYEHRSEVRPDLGFTYPPFAALLLAPLTVGSKDAAGLTWAALNLLMVAWLVTVAWEELPAPAREAAGTAGLLAAIAGMWQLAPVHLGIHLGQVGILLATLVTADLVALKRGWRWAGVCTGVAAAVKLTPLVFVPLLWMAGRRRAASVAVAVFLASTAVSALLFPADFARFWSRYLFETGRVGTAAADANNALSALAARTGLPSPAQLALWVTLATIVCVVGLARAGRSGASAHLVPAAVAVSCLGVAVTPLSWTHHAVMATMTLPLLLSRRRDDPLFAFGVLLAAALLDLPARGLWWWTSGLRTVLFVLIALGPALLAPPAELWLTGSSRLRRR